MMLCLALTLLFTCAVQGQGRCGSTTDCPVYLDFARRQNEVSLQPFFDTVLGGGLLRYIDRCCKSIIPGEDECGFPEPSGPINDLQRRGAWPWFVAVGILNGTEFVPYCGGSLITRRHVLTAAHCTTSPIKLEYVRVGDYDLEQPDEANHQTLRIIRFQDPGYIRPSEGNDITIITLEKDVEFNDFLRPVCLPFKFEQEKFYNEHLAVVGYGHTSSGTTANVPLAGSLPVVEQNECNQVFEELDITDAMLCAGGKQDACQGDGGGPLNYYDVNTERFYIVGIVSFGKFPCGQEGIPGVYTRVGAYLPWIKSSIERDFL